MYQCQGNVNLPKFNKDKEFFSLNKKTPTSGILLYGGGEESRTPVQEKFHIQTSTV